MKINFKTIKKVSFPHDFSKADTAKNTQFEKYIPLKFFYHINPTQSFEPLSLSLRTIEPRFKLHLVV